MTDRLSEIKERLDKAPPAAAYGRAAGAIVKQRDDLRWLIAELEKERLKSVEVAESFAYFLEEKSCWGRRGDGDQNCWCMGKSCFADGKATRDICRFGNDQLEIYYKNKEMS